MEREDGGLTRHSVDCETGKAHQYSSSTSSWEQVKTEKSQRRN